MSAAIDVNVLLFASDTASPLHLRAADFLDRYAAGPDVLYLAWSTVMSYLRISTHPAIFANPLQPEEAAHNAETLVRLPHVRMLAEEDGFWDLYREVTKKMATRGHDVPDAHLATLLRQHGVATLYTSDRDFRKFDFLNVLDPFAK
jgi:toxin-antitoxin system PIN domain toxin